MHCGIMKETYPKKRRLTLELRRGWQAVATLQAESFPDALVGGWWMTAWWHGGRPELAPLQTGAGLSLFSFSPLPSPPCLSPFTHTPQTLTDDASSLTSVTRNSQWLSFSLFSHAAPPMTALPKSKPKPAIPASSQSVTTTTTALIHRYSGNNIMIAHRNTRI